MGCIRDTTCQILNSTLMYSSSDHSRILITLRFKLLQIAHKHSTEYICIYIFVYDLKRKYLSLPFSVLHETTQRDTRGETPRARNTLRRWTRTSVLSISRSRLMLLLSTQRVMCVPKRVAECHEKENAISTMRNGVEFGRQTGKKRLLASVERWKVYAGAAETRKNWSNDSSSARIVPRQIEFGMNLRVLKLTTRRYLCVCVCSIRETQITLHI